MVNELTDANAEQFLTGDNLKVIKFSAPWCSACKKLDATIWPQLESENPDVSFLIADTDKTKGLVSRFEVRMIPQVTYFKNGKALESLKRPTTR